jgi:tetratricopeptide (TPR) repeat protein
MIYISKHQWEKAWDLMTKAKTYYPEHPYNNALLAQLYCETDDLQKAMPLFENAVKTGLDYADMYFNFAICQINHRIYKESRQNFFKVIEFNPAEVESYYFIAVTYDREKNYERAAFYYKTFLSKATKSPWLDEVRVRLKHLESMGVQGEGLKE